MKGMVFSLGRFQRRKRNRITPKQFFSKYGLFTFFASCILVGFIFGMIGVKNADKPLLSSLEFLFLTNIESRIEQTAFQIFCTCFSSNFIFLLCSFLLGLSAWGFLMQPIFTVVKGYGVGLSAGYLFSVYGIKGAGFYMLVMLLGIVVFAFSLICECTNAFRISLRCFKLLLLNSEKEPYINQGIKVYMYRSGYMLMIATVASLVDMILWVLFAGIFNFT